MDAENHDLVRRLFVLATEIIEAAHEASISGQGSEMVPAELVAAAERVRCHAGKLTVIAQTILAAIKTEAVA